jgi:hypothetical protein
VLMELAREQESFAEGADEQTRHIVSELYDMGEQRRPRTAELTVSFYELCKRLNLHAGGSAGSQRRSELKRLCEMTVWSRREDGVEFQSRLLTWQVGNRQGVRVLLNWRLTEVLFGGHFSAVCLNERLELRSECARALHCALSLRIRVNGTMSFHLDKLASYVWADVEPRSVAKRQKERAYSDTPAGIAQRRRRGDLLDALAEIAHLSAWSVKSAPSGALRISRRTTIGKGGTQEIATVPAVSANPKATKKRLVADESKDGQVSIWQMLASAAALPGTR